MAEEHLRNRMARNPIVVSQRKEIERRVMAGDISPTQAAKLLIDAVDEALSLR